MRLKIGYSGKGGQRLFEKESEKFLYSTVHSQNNRRRTRMSPENVFDDELECKFYFSSW